MDEVLRERKLQVLTKGKDEHSIKCDVQSTAGSVSQRACTFCGSRVVLYPISDALHIIHGPVGCAAYTWDIRGALSSGPQLHRMSFVTDLKERDIIFGGEKKLTHALRELIETYKPKAAFVYGTCIVGVIGDDLEAICKLVGAETNIPVIPVEAAGFKGTKKDGYKIACDALSRLVGTLDDQTIPEHSINILGDFNLAGELWVLLDYYKKMGINVVATITGDGRVDDIRRSHKAALNVVQCSGSMTYLAKDMKEKYGIPFKKVSYFGLEDMSDALYTVAEHFKDEKLLEKARELVTAEYTRIMPAIKFYREKLQGKKAAIYVGGSFKAISLIKALRLIGIKTVVVGSQTGITEEYKILQDIADEGTIIVDDSNPVELSTFVKQTGADLLIGGVKERPIAYKLGLGFCDHNHERKEALAGYEGMINFAKEVYSSVMSPVWKLKSR